MYLKGPKQLMIQIVFLPSKFSVCHLILLWTQYKWVQRSSPLLEARRVLSPGCVLTNCATPILLRAKWSFSACTSIISKRCQREPKNDTTKWSVSKNWQSSPSILCCGVGCYALHARYGSVDWNQSFSEFGGRVALEFRNGMNLMDLHCCGWDTHNIPHGQVWLTVAFLQSRDNCQFLQLTSLPPSESEHECDNRKRRLTLGSISKKLHIFCFCSVRECFSLTCLSGWCTWGSCTKRVRWCTYSARALGLCSRRLRIFYSFLQTVNLWIILELSRIAVRIQIHRGLIWKFCTVRFVVFIKMITVIEGHRREVRLTKYPHVPLSTWSLSAADCDLNTLCSRDTCFVRASPSNRWLEKILWFSFNSYQYAWALAYSARTVPTSSFMVVEGRSLDFRAQMCWKQK